MKAYKFLATGAIGPMSGFAWPAAGEWVGVEGPLALCVHGVHVCRTFELAHWLHDELWEVETSGDRLEGLDCLVVRSARLVRRIDAWSAGGARRFADACIEHATALAGPHVGAVEKQLLDDAVSAAGADFPAVGAYCAALVVAKVHGEGAYEAERSWQSAWIARELCET